MLLQARTEAFRRLQGLHEKDQMRIAHAHGGTTHSGMSWQLLIDKRGARPRRRQLRGDQLGLSHRRFDFLSHTVAVSGPALLYPPVRFNTQSFPPFALM